MPKVVPFKACRPTRDKASLVGSRSFIEYSDMELNDKLNNNPYSFLHVIYPGFRDGTWHGLSNSEKYTRVRASFEDFVERGILMRDKQAHYYIYRQSKHGESCTGIVCGVSVEDYKKGHVKVHEHTLTQREEMFKEYLLQTRINVEPVLLAHPDNAAIEQVIQSVSAQRAEYEFTTTDEITHCLWLVNDVQHTEIIEKAFSEMPDFYIADGHHRSASSVRLAEELGGNTNAVHQSFLSYLVSESQLRIYEFNRLVKTIKPHTEDSFLQSLLSNFTVIKCDATPREPALHTLHMYLNKQWYTLQPNAAILATNDPVEQLDCQILSRYILEPILGISDLKTDKRIAFLGGNAGDAGLQKAVDSGNYEVAFSLFPVTMEQLKNVADEGMIMPPKSTWVEPKLRSGLIIYELE
jgi:uncharacterized protein (DUF1015 family)